MTPPTSATAIRVYQDMALSGRVLGADPHALVAILFDELLLALAVADRALARGDGALVAARRERARTILFALSGSLSRDASPDLADALGQVYAAAARSVERAGPEAPTGFRDAAAWIGDIAEAWNAIAA